MKPSRREFLQSIIASGFLLPSFSALAASIPSNTHEGIAVGSINDAVLFDLNTSEVKVLKTGFIPHSLAPISQAQLTYIAIPWGKDAAFLSFRDNTVRPISAGDDLTFLGHGIYSETNKLVLMASMDYKTGQGRILGYDPLTFKKESDWEIRAGILHECHYLPDGNLMIGGGGIVMDDVAHPTWVERKAKAAMVIIDPKTGKVLHETQLDDPTQSLNHFTVTKRGQVLALTAWPHVPGPFLGHIYITDTPDGPLRRLEFEPPLEAPVKGDMLSVALNDDHTLAAVTCPSSQMIAFINMQQGRIVSTMKSFSNWVGYSDVLNGFVSLGHTNDSVSVVEKDGAEKPIFTGSPAALATPFISAHAVTAKIEV